MKVAYCRANEMAIESWLEDMCISKACPHLVYMYSEELVELYRRQGLL